MQSARHAVMVLVIGATLGATGCTSGPESAEPEPTTSESPAIAATSAESTAAEAVPGAAIETPAIATLSPAEEALLALDFGAFDQDADGGWRTLANEGRFEDGARLIDAYIARRSEDVEPAQLILLNFHAGQLYAMGDAREPAVERFEAAIDPSPAMESWNPYVQATIAFLENDRAALLAAREAMAATSDGAMNMPVVDRLVEHLGKSYREALMPPSGS